jgi:hypothetical protein
VYQVSIIGPVKAVGPGDTPSRQELFFSRPRSVQEEDACAQEIIGLLLRRAYRRPVGDDDLTKPMQMFHEGRSNGDFDDGIRLALSSILVSPSFLFHIERDPSVAVKGTPYRIGDVELASRLSFFLWSSLPDDELLELAEHGQLHQPRILEQQVRRMLKDERAKSLATNFAGQWLYLPNLDSFMPDMRLYPDFDDNLRQAMRQETELFFESIVRDDRSVLTLLNADYTFLNERLAKHYGIPHIYGSHFRRVMLDEQTHRCGLLGHASIMAVTSYATRTSPVLRGQWVLKNLLGSPPPPPPPNVPVLAENSGSTTRTVRALLEQHRANPACAACHELMDPAGFALENWDAVGRWRETDSGEPIDASGGLPDGSEFNGPAGLRKALLARPDLFVRTLTDKLMTFALGRGLEYYDAPAVRKVVADAADDDYRFSSLILCIVNSTPFQMRMAP